MNFWLFTECGCLGGYGEGRGRGGGEGHLGLLPNTPPSHLCWAGGLPEEGSAKGEFSFPLPPPPSFAGYPTVFFR